MQKKRADLHVSTSVQTEKQAGRVVVGWGGEISSSAFQRLLTGFLLRWPRNRQRTFLPLIAADETLMCLCLPSTWHMEAVQIQAAAMCCGQPWHAKPGQGLNEMQFLFNTNKAVLFKCNES